jgi:hypothetical protein
MALSWDLEDWLTAAGDRVVNKMAALGPEALDQTEQLVYEVWVFDTETRNGGVSQYFGNRGLVRWDSLRAASQNHPMPNLKKFIAEVDQILEGARDPYATALKVSPPIEERYWLAYQASIVEELRHVLSIGA